MSDENEREVAQLLDLKQRYRYELAEMEVAQRVQMAKELSKKKRELAEKYATQLAEKITEKVAASLKPLLLEVFTQDE